MLHIINFCKKALNEVHYYGMLGWMAKILKIVCELLKCLKKELLSSNNCLPLPSICDML